jgi:hypothetical protein
MAAGVTAKLWDVGDFGALRTAFEAVLADLRQTSPDFIFHGGNPAD